MLIGKTKVEYKYQPSPPYLCTVINNKILFFYTKAHTFPTSSFTEEEEATI